MRFDLKNVDNIPAELYEGMVKRNKKGEPDLFKLEKTERTFAIGKQTFTVFFNPLKNMRNCKSKLKAMLAGELIRHDPLEALNFMNNNYGDLHRINETAGNFETTFYLHESDVPILTAEQMEKRAAIYWKMVTRCMDEDVMRACAEKYEKKKNGTFYRGRVLHVAMEPFCDQYGYMHAIAAVADDDNHLELSTRSIYLEKIDANWLAEHIDIL